MSDLAVKKKKYPTLLIGMNISSKGLKHHY